MIVGPPLEGSSSNEVADWLELEVLMSASNSAPLRAINQTLEIAEDEEPEDLDQENIVADRRLQQAVAAIDERRVAMKAAYPFELDAQGLTLRMRGDIDAGGYAYLFCLIVSAGAPGGLLNNVEPSPDLAKARGLFQICATVASAGFVVGPAFSIGWPRPHSSAFLDKLRAVYQQFGDGRIHAALPPGAPPAVKDDSIDVIAWKHTSQMKPPMGYFLGQAASGADWLDKGLPGHVARFHGTWFSQQPAATAKLGTIMPFCLPSEADADVGDHEAQEEIVGRLRRFTLAHHELLYRHRVAIFLADGVKVEEAGKGPVERIGDLPKLVSFVSSYREELRDAAAATL